MRETQIKWKLSQINDSKQNKWEIELWGYLKSLKEKQRTEDWNKINGYWVFGIRYQDYILI